ncbi:MAG: hypothetical protein BBJ57_03025, partial [Desulfobacterales bacterium PC51MH44]
WTPSHIKKTSQRVFQNIGITVIEIYQMICLSEEEILNKVQIKGEANLHNALKEEKGVILISAHLGNWEIMPLYWSLYFKTPIAVVARQIRNNIFNRWIDRLRTRFGNRVIDKEGALPEMTRTLRQNKMLGILIDQGTKSSLGVKITFFNKFVTATPAAVLLAMRCKSPVLPVFCTRNDDGILTITVEPPLSLERTNDLRADLKTNTQIIMDAIEKAVREYPEQWFWVHKRWKKYYPQLYPEYMAKRRRRRKKKLETKKANLLKEYWIKDKRFSGIHIYGPLRDEFAPAIYSLLNGDLPNEWEWVKSSSGSIVARRLDPPTVYYKEFLNRSPLETFKGLFRSSRCKRARVKREILIKKGFDSPAIYCWGRQGLHHFMITEGIDAIGMGEFIYKRWWPPLDKKKISAKRVIIEELASTIGRLHKTGIFHGDLRLNNILMHHTHEEVTFHFIDNEGNRIYKKIPKHLVEKNLVQLNLIFPKYVTRQDRFRFYKTYNKVYERFSRAEQIVLMQRVQNRTLKRLKKIAQRTKGV